MALSIIASQAILPVQALATSSTPVSEASIAQQATPLEVQTLSTSTASTQYTLTLNVDGALAGVYNLNPDATTVTAYVDFAYSNVQDISVYQKGETHTWENVTGSNGSTAGYTFDNGTANDTDDDTFVSVSFGGGAGGSEQESLNNLACYINNPQADMVLSIQTVGFSTGHNTLSISNDSNLTLINNTSEHQISNRAEFTYRWLVKSGYEVDYIKVSYGSSYELVEVGGATLVIDSGTKISANIDGTTNYLTVSITNTLEDLQIHADAHRAEVDLTASGSNLTGTSATIQWQGDASILITPDSGYSIVSLTANGNPLTIGGTATVEGVLLTAIRNADGTVTVKGLSTGDYSFSDIHITATATKDMHFIDVTTDTTLTSSIYNASLHSGDALEMTLTPDEGYEVSYISVNYNGATGTIPVTGGYGVVGGKTFNTSITTGDTVKLTMQGINSDVQISATSVKKDVDSYNVTVVTDDGLTASANNISLTEGAGHNLILTPSSGYEVDSIEINYMNQYRNLALTGTIQTIEGKDFYARTQANGTVQVTIPAIEGNLLINATSLKNEAPANDEHTLTIFTDNNVTSSKTYENITEGGSETFTLTPNSNYEVSSITVSYGGQTGTLFLTGTTLTLDDCSFVATALANGSVSVTTTGIANDVSFNVASVSSDSATYQFQIFTDSNLTSNIDSTVVATGGSQSVTLTPVGGYGVDSIKVSYDGKSGTLTSSSGSLILSGTTFTMTTSSGTVVVNASNVCGVVTLEATSLFGSSTVDYTLTVNVDSRITSNITSETVQEGSTQIVNLTPDYKFAVANVTLAYNDEVKTITLDGEAVRVGGEAFTATRMADGVIQVEIPSMDGDIEITAESGIGQYLIEVDSGDFTDSVYDGEQFIGLYDQITVTFTPNMVVFMQSLKVTTSRGSTTADFSAQKIAVDGYYYNIGIDEAGNGYIIIDSTDRDLKIEPIIYQTALLATIIDESGVSHDRDSKEAVEEGDEYTVTFTPDVGYYIDNIELKYGSTVYELESSSDLDYITLDGERNPIVISDNGEVTIQILSASENMTFTVDARKYDGFVITRNTDLFTHVSHTGTAPFDEEDTTTITVTPMTGYVVNRVTLKDDTDTVTFYSEDESFLFNGVRYEVRWNSDDSGSFTMTGLSSNLNIVTAGVPYTSDQSIISRHEAYLNGYGNGMFGINSSMTRAEAVTMMTTLFFPNYDFSTTSGNQHFIDVAGNVWYSNPVNFAASQGLIQVIVRTSGSFNPDEPITRAELVALMCAYSKMSVPAATQEQVFEDMKDTHWAYQYVHTAAQNGWVAGYEDGTFRPENQISRAEVTVMMNRVLGRCADPNATFITQFTDVSPSHWAYLDIMEATNTHTVAYYDGDGEVWA